MPVDFYYALLSPPCRAVLLTARHLGIDLNLKEVDLFSGEHLKPEFLSLNPEHTLPTLVDGDFVLWESRAVSSYLANQYGGEYDSLYPQDPKLRSKVDRGMMFDMGTLYKSFSKYVVPVTFQGKKPDPEGLKSLLEALGVLDKSLDGSTYAVGDHITLADHCLAATVETIKQAKRSNLLRFRHVQAWLLRCEESMPGYDDNVKGAKIFGDLIAAKFAEHATK